MVSRPATSFSYFLYAPTANQEREASEVAVLRMACSSHIMDSVSGNCALRMM